MKKTPLNQSFGCTLAGLMVLMLVQACVPAVQTPGAMDEKSASTNQRPDWARELPAHTHAYEFPSGLRLVVYENHASEIVTMDTWVGVGSADETDANNGVSHFLEHLLFKGTERFGPRELDRRLESLGARINAATSDDYTHYFVTVSSKHFETALDMHADMLLNAALPAPEIDHERKVVIEEINRANDNPRRKLYIAMQEQLYAGHAYHRDTLGPPENIASIPREEIVNYYSRWYVPGNMTVVIAGDVNHERARGLVAKYFQSNRGGALPARQRGKLQPIEKPVEITIEDQVQQAHIAVAWRAPSVSDFEDSIALDVAALIVGQGASSRLHRRLVEEDQLALSVGAGNYTQKDAGSFYVFATCPPQNVEKVRAAIMEEIERLSRAAITSDELAKAHLTLERDFVYESESSAGMARLFGYYAAVSQVSDVAAYRTKLAQTDALRVVEAVRSWLRPDRVAAVRVLPERTDLTTIEKPESRQASSVQLEQEEDSTSISRSELDNGTTLIVKENPESEVVAFHGMLRGGARAAHKAGLADLVSRVVMKGTDSRTAEALAQEIESSGISLSVSADEDYISVTGKGFEADLPRLLVILRDLFYNATLSQEEIDKERGRMLREILISRDQPSGVAFEQARLALFPNHPYGDVGKRIERDLPKIARKDVVEFYRTHFRPELLTLAVVGNVRTRDVGAMVHDLFPTPSGSSPKLNLPKDQRDLAEPRVVRTPKETAQTWVVRGYRVPGIESEDYAALKVATSVLGHGLSGRLFVNLRERRGLAYTTSAMYESRADTTGFYLYIGTDPRNTRAVREGFDAEMERLRTERISGEELKEAKNKFIGAFDLSHEGNAGQAFYLAFYELMGRGFQFDEAYTGLIEQVTAEDVQRVARKYLSEFDVESIVGPAAMIDPDAELPALTDIETKPADAMN